MFIYDCEKFNKNKKKNVKPIWIMVVYIFVRDLKRVAIEWVKKIIRRTKTFYRFFCNFCLNFEMVWISIKKKINEGSNVTICTYDTSTYVYIY